MNNAVIFELVEDDGIYEFVVVSATDEKSKTKQTPYTELVLKITEAPYEGYAQKEGLYYASPGAFKRIKDFLLSVGYPGVDETSTDINYDEANLVGMKGKFRLGKESYYPDENDKTQVKFKNKVEAYIPKS